MDCRTENLDEIETVTLGYYDENAESFWEGTKDHDVAQNYAAFLAPFPDGKTLDILDLGCGPGRDVKYFQSLGHRPIGLDGSVPGNTLVAKFFTKGFSALRCNRKLSMASLQMPLCSMSLVGNCRMSLKNYTAHYGPPVFCFHPTLGVTTRDGMGNGTAIICS